MKINSILSFFVIGAVFFACNPNHKETNTKETKELHKRNGMVWISGGVFTMGSVDAGFPDAQPLHQVEIDGFWMDETEVTNAQFAVFVKATGYITIAERKIDPKDFPDVPLENLVPGSAVFSLPPTSISGNEPLQWWRYIKNANWKQPFGDGSKCVANQPVVHITYVDAVAYANWAGK